MFLDEVKINIKAGDGGNGMVSFHYLKGSRKKIASGGNGGKGGNVITRASSNINTLYSFTKKIHFKAPNGQSGLSNKKNGKNGEDIIIYVPVGTIIKDKEKIIADLNSEGSEVLITEGGIGGRGNSSFVSQERRFPNFAEKGEKVKEKWINLELRLIADAALIGFPNTGKSTLISRISAARPKIADYPFTTLTPILGVVSIDDDAFVIADIPGIIEGAHEGTGLGDKFLRHIMRSRVLVIMLDGQQLFEGKDKLIDTFEIIRMEIKLYDYSLFKKDYLVVINKIDLFSDRLELEKAKKILAKKCKKQVYFISAITGEGLTVFIRALYEKILSSRELEIELRRKSGVDEKFKIYNIDKKMLEDEKIEIIKDSGEYIVKNKKLERMVAMTDLENEEALEYLKYKLKKMKIGDRLKLMGIKEGSTIIIDNLVFELKE
jgi:GTP-binding protein